MAVPIASVSNFVPTPHSPPADDIPLILTVHLLGLATGTAMIVGLIPAAIALLRVLL